MTLRARLPELTPTHAALALSLVLSGGLLWELRQTRQALRHEVEQGVSAGIQDGVGAALNPADVQASSAAATRGVVDGLVGDETRQQADRAGARVGQAGLDLLEGALGDPEPSPPPVTPAPADASAADPAPAVERPTRARRAGELVGDTLDLGLSVAEALLGKPAPPPQDPEPEPARGPR